MDLVVFTHGIQILWTTDYRYKLSSKFDNLFFFLSKSLKIQFRAYNVVQPGIFEHF